MVFEHITTKEGAHYVRDAEGRWRPPSRRSTCCDNRNAIFQGGVRPHWYCLPILKRETHRLALLEAATGGSPRFFLGTDSAPHARGLKEHACGCAGCYTALHAMELYATAFENAGKLDKLEGSASFHGPDFYGLPRNAGHADAGARGLRRARRGAFRQHVPGAAGGGRIAEVARAGLSQPRPVPGVITTRPAWPPAVPSRRISLRVLFRAGPVRR